MVERIRALWARVKDDIHRNPGLWIGVGISAVILVVAYLAYRQSQANGNSNNPLVPANGYGIPDYGTSTGGSSNGGFFGGYSPYQPISPYTPTYTPTSAGTTATSTPPTYQTAAPALPFSLALAGTSTYGSYGYSAPAAPVASSPLNTIIGAIQNPLAAAQLAHVGTPTTSYAIQNPTATQTFQHTGTTYTAPAPSYPIQNPTATQTYQHRGTTAPTSYTVPHVNTYARLS